MKSISPSNCLHIHALDGFETYAIDENTIGVRPIWFSVKDKLPEEGVKVLSFSKFEKDIKVDYIIYAPEPLWACRLLSDEIEVTHWMHLPKPPK